MAFFRFSTDSDRWKWFAAGDDSLDRPAASAIRHSPEDSSPVRVLWEVGLIVVIPLVFAALIQLVFAALAQ